MIDEAALHELVRLLDVAHEHVILCDPMGHDCKGAEGIVSLAFNSGRDRRQGAPLSLLHVEIYSYCLGPSRTHRFPSLEDALEAVREWYRQAMADTPEV